ncbi:hypothetical protein ACO0K0_02550 [Undibacterium sp. SXout11W]|uniref:hypothetical protein n=1 Tax=Undibacterium sp. SXout11W TaxID=3413050 RepID=UPI003BF3FDBB
MQSIDPDRLTLEIAHSRLKIVKSFGDAMRDPTYKKLIETRAKALMKKRGFDSKKFQANDKDQS